MPTILLIDDDPASRALTREALTSGYVVIEIATQEQYRSVLAQGGFNFVVTEYRLPWIDGFCVFADLHRLYPGVPVIMLTKYGNEMIAAQAIKQGMADYINKDLCDRLPEAISRALQKSPENPHCLDEDTGILWCERWDQVISKLTSDFAYSLRIDPEGQPRLEWITEPFRRFLDNHGSPGDRLKPADFHFGLDIHPDDLALASQHVAALLNGVENIAEYRIVSKRGDVRCFCDHALPIRDWSSGRIVRIYGTIQDITWRRDAEDKMRLLQRAIDSSKNGIIITDLADNDYAISYVNQAFLQLTGYSSEEWIGQNCRILQGQDRDQAEIDNLRRALQDKREGYAILRNYRKDGSPFWNEIYISPVTDSHSRITHYLGVQNDVTPRVEMEMALRQSELKMQTIFDNVSEAILIFDQDGCVTRANKSAEGMFGYPGGEMIGVKLERFLPKESRKIHKDYLANHTDKSPPLAIGKREITALKKDGSQFLVDVGVNEIGLGNGYLFVTTIHDLTEGKRAEAQLKASEERYRALFENAEEAIFVNRGGSRIEQVNRACIQLWRASSAEQLLAKLPLELFHPDYHAIISKRIEDAVANQNPQATIEEKIIRFDGTVADVLVSGIPFVDQQGPLIFVVILDISSRKAAEAALLASNQRIQDLSRHMEIIREEERTHIAREIHDDLGATLTALKMELSWLLNQLPEELTLCRNRTREIIEEVNSGIQTVKRIITNLRPTLLDHLGLLPAIEWLVENFHRRSNIHCVLNLPEVDLSLDNDRNTAIFRITQEALTNILAHAKATEVAIGLELENSYLLLTICDNGKGMPARPQQKPEGYGIQGMRERAQYFGAELSVDSHPKSGTCIRLKMPLTPPPPPHGFLIKISKYCPYNVAPKILANFRDYDQRTTFQR